MDHSPILAIIVPCFCEEEVLPSTNERLRALLADIVTRDDVTGRKVRYGNDPYIQNAAYEYEVATGNMMMRTDSIYGHEEAFAYDYLNRLTDNGTGGYAYDTKGNIVRRDGVGGYGYSSSSPYAVSEVPFNAMIPQRDQRINYNALQLPDSICL